jgi:hypothetical protein
MITFQLQPISEHLCRLQEMQDYLNNLIEKHPTTVKTRLTVEAVDKIKGNLDVVLEGIELIDLIAAPRFIRQILSRLSDMSYMRLHENIIQLREMIIGELKEVFLIFIPNERHIWLEKAKAEYNQILQSFPSALDDCQEAAFCYACGRYTAAVFHAMRILEYGLGALSKEVGLTFDVQQWYDIINQIEKKIKEAQNRPKSLDKSDHLQFLSEAAKEFTYFKDGWRNYVSHGRSKYDGPQALSALNHVKTFMVHLATRLSE